MEKIKAFINKLFRTKHQDIALDKHQIRKLIRYKKNQISEKDKQIQAAAVFEKIEKLEEFQNAKNILVYWSMPDELSTHNFVIKWSRKKQMLLPVVKDDEMLIKPFSSKDELKQGSLGIWEPDAQKEFLHSIDLVIVPGMAFDKNKSRLGRGKGYYDKYFVNKNIVKIGVGFDFQLLEKIPTATFDIKMDKIITKSTTIE